MGGEKKKRDEIGSEELHERGLLGLPVQSLHASLEDWGGGRFGGGEGGNGSCHRCVSPSVCTLAAAATAETETRRFKRSRAAAALTPSSVAFMHGLHAFSPSRAAVRAQQLSPDTDAQGRSISPGHFSDIAVIFALLFVGFSDD